ncbi:MAG: CPBP family intramembrane metalloprotease [Eubacteriales bacterium]|nr:CPBP family intramembrane metalloprotease [Eubacteriales bacterium]
MDMERRARRQVRRSADIIGLTILASTGINYLLYPLIRLIPDYADGTLENELLNLILYIIVFAVPFVTGAKLSGMSGKDLLGDGKPPAEVYLMTIGLVLGWSFAAGCLGTGIEEFLNRFGLTEVSQEYILPADKTTLAIQFVSVAIIPPIVEEISFRGFYLNIAERSMGTWAAICMTAICFWLAHYSIEILPLAFGFGMIGGYIRRRYGSLLPSMFAHFAVNSVYMVVNVGYAAGGEHIGTALALLVYLIEVLLGAVGIVLFVRRGCLREIWKGHFGRQSELLPGQIAFAVLTSIPALLVVILSVYFTSGNLEAL